MEQCDCYSWVARNLHNDAMYSVHMSYSQIHTKFSNMQRLGPLCKEGWQYFSSELIVQLVDISLGKTTTAKVAKSALRRHLHNYTRLVHSRSAFWIVFDLDTESLIPSS